MYRLLVKLHFFCSCVYNSVCAWTYAVYNFSLHCLDNLDRPSILVLSLSAFQLSVVWREVFFYSSVVILYIAIIFTGRQYWFYALVLFNKCCMKRTLLFFSVQWSGQPDIEFSPVNISLKQTQGFSSSIGERLGCVITKTKT